MAFACRERLKSIELCWLNDANVQFSSNKLLSLSPRFVSSAWFDRKHEKFHADKIENIELHLHMHSIGRGHQNRWSAITTHNVVIVVVFLLFGFCYPRVSHFIPDIRTILWPHRKINERTSVQSIKKAKWNKW